MTSARSTSLRWAAGVTVSLLALTACGGTDDGATPTTSSSPSVTTEPSTTPTPTLSPSETSTAPPPTSDAPTSDAPTSEAPVTKPIRVLATIKAGQVTTANDTVDVTGGDAVTLVIRTDTADTLHIHGVEQEEPLTANARTVVNFTIPTDLAPGQYEVETHDNPLLVFTLVVT